MTNNVTTAVDRLGQLKALIAELKTEETALKGILIENGPGAYDGDLFRATVTEAERATLDLKAVRAKLTPQFIAAHTNVTDVTTVRVVARIT